MILVEKLILLEFQFCALWETFGTLGKKEPQPTLLSQNDVSWVTLIRSTWCISKWRHYKLWNRSFKYICSVQREWLSRKPMTEEQLKKLSSDSCALQVLDVVFSCSLGTWNPLDLRRDAPCGSEWMMHNRVHECMTCCGARVKKAFIERISPQDGWNLILYMEAAEHCKSMFVHWNRNNFRASSARNFCH